MLGKVFVKVKYKQQVARVPLVIVKGDRPALLGRNWLKKIRLDWKEIFQVKAAGTVTDPEVARILQKHNEVFKDDPSTIGEFKASIKMRPDAQPVFKKANPVPYLLKEAVEKELDRLEAMGFISKADKSEWAAPLVTVPKADKSIRICGNYKVNVNQCVEEETYPLPNAEDLFATPAGGKLDLSHAYQQLELDKDSEKYLTVNAHRGLYTYHRSLQCTIHFPSSDGSDPTGNRECDLFPGWHLDHSKFKRGTSVQTEGSFESSGKI